MLKEVVEYLLSLAGLILVLTPLFMVYLKIKEDED